MVECARLESVYAARYQGFESLTLRNRYKLPRKGYYLYQQMKILKERFKKPLGIFFLIIGIISVLTPFTPLGFLVLVGLELLGLRERAMEKLNKIRKSRDRF